VEEDPSQASEIEIPEGMYPSRMDDRGRVKLPVLFQKYLEEFKDKRLFVTSLDRRIARVYPIIRWKQTKKFMETYSGDPKVAKHMAFNAADLGAITEMDSQARVLFSPELRRELRMEDQPVHLYANRGHIKVFTQAVYDEDKLAAAAKAAAELEQLDLAGMD
jgi:DNA-binding transcriptional regulator/RsmH inhibitor MraZ